MGICQNEWTEPSQFGFRNRKCGTTSSANEKARSDAPRFSNLTNRRSVDQFAVVDFSASGVAVLPDFTPRSKSNA
jgi:hypothetical protein